MSTSGLRLGVLVPARDEASVLARKLRNLARVDWPAGVRHRVIVVDDGSTDGTGACFTALAHALRRARPEVDWALVPGPGSGKARAIRAGLAALGHDGNGPVDLVVLTDADVVLETESLVAFAEAFEEAGGADPPLLLASGSQRFVEALDPDGRPAGPGCAALRSRGDLYDRVTAWVRAAESRVGRVFSVHGQLLAWPLASGLEPTPGFAADDLDLMFAARRAGGRVRMVRGARFLETKPAGGGLRGGQQKRRAEGYFQVLAGWRARVEAACPLGSHWLDRLQWWFYAVVPGASPWLALVATVLLFLGAAAWGAVPFAGALVLLALFALSPVGRELLELARIIHAARRNVPAARDGGYDRWQPPRELA